MNETKLTNREQRLLIFLPAAMVLVAYSFLIALPKQRAYSNKLAELEDTRDTAVDEMTATQSEVNLRLARDGLNRLKSRLQKDRASISDRSQSWRNLESRLETVEAVTELLAIYNLIVVSQNYQEDPTISEYMKGLYDEIASASSTEVKFWEIELEGGYNEIQAFLSAINNEGLKTIPVTLNMTASEENDGRHTWTIIFVV